MNIEKHGNAWVYGDNIDTDLLAPGAYMKAPIEKLAQHCLEAIDPRFAKRVKPGDILIAGHAFGIGSSREQAVQALLELGIAAVVVKSCARIFYRNAINLGLPVLICPTLSAIEQGHSIAVNVANARINNRTLAQSFACEPMAPKLLTIIDAGGLIPYLKTTLDLDKKITL
ncbi:3-isopropylmalate dehydratase [Thalassotalea maritima]|uniref:LeuD/DmdB family oxidoreductase small subunit n=1 Tax=Thalassotalea maritima TaxID=3242416 RepID=UPI003528CB1D